MASAQPHSKCPSLSTRTGTSRAAITLLAILSFSVIPSIAHGHANAPGSAANDAVGRYFSRISEKAPTATKYGKCTQTIRVMGQGKSCIDRDGTWRVKTRRGKTLLTHGPDLVNEVEKEAKALGGIHSQKLAAASLNDIVCVYPGGTKRTTLIYAYASDRSDRSSRYAPILRREAIKASAFMNAEANASGTGSGARLRLACDQSNQPIVLSVGLRTPSAADSFESIVSDLQDLGYGTDTSHQNNDRYLIYYDNAVGQQYAGQGILYGDDSPTIDNENNRGGAFAVQYAVDSSGPHWSTLLHEAGHNMGAVADDAPGSTKGGHCNIGEDIMCYADGGPQSNYTDTTCLDIRLDCGKDTYFNASPAPGSYLDSHWNMARWTNQYIDIGRSGPAVNGEGNAPSAPAITSATGHIASATLEWTASTDDTGVLRYDLYSGAPGSMEYLGSSATTNASVVGLIPGRTHTISVIGRDRSGNRSEPASTSITTQADLVAPMMSSKLRRLSASVGSATFGWKAARDNAGIRGYRVQILKSGKWRTLATPSAGRRNHTVFTTRRRASFRVRVQAIDLAGQTSRWSKPLTIRSR